jgi:two-component system, NarL family, sensor kinase
MPSDAIVTIFVGTFILILVAGFTVSILFVYQKKYYKHLQEINSIKENYEQEILKTQLEIKEQTLQNISQEIHDNIGQVLSLANLQLTAIELPGNLFAMNKIDKSMELVSKAIYDLRNLSKTMNAENIIKAGLVKCIEADLELIERTGKFSTSIRISGTERRINSPKEIIIYRIVQEAMNNIVKHSKASCIQIELHYDRKKLSVAITDNGEGFSTNEVAGMLENGSGVKNMQNRARLIQGSLYINSNHLKGTTISLQIPFEDF